MRACLQMLLRHALLREIAYAAARLQADETGADLAALLRDAELVDLVTGAPPTNHWRRQLERTLTVTGGRTIREYLETQTTFTTPALAALGEFRSSLADLKNLDSEALAQLTQGTLDLSAYRLDAWVTSVATKRLAAMHVDGPNGQYVGAYGWVENLKPMPASFVKPVTTLPAGEPGPLQTPANDSGFIHAPSMTHAATAALAAQRTPRSFGCAERHGPVRDRAVLAPGPGSLAAARRRAAGPTPRRAARLPRRAPAPRDRRRQRPHHGPLHRPAAPRGAARRARGRQRRPDRSIRSPPRTSSMAWSCTAGGRKSAARSSRRCRRRASGRATCRRSRRSSTGSAT